MKTSYGIMIINRLLPCRQLLQLFVHTATAIHFFVLLFLKTPDASPAYRIETSVDYWSDCIIFTTCYFYQRQYRISSCEESSSWREFEKSLLWGQICRKRTLIRARSGWTRPLKYASILWRTSVSSCSRSRGYGSDFRSCSSRSNELQYLQRITISNDSNQDVQNIVSRTIIIMVLNIID